MAGKAVKTMQHAPVVQAEVTPSELKAQQERVNDLVRKKEVARRVLHHRYSEEEKVDVCGAPMYQAYFGRQMCISINTIPIYVPLDGRHYQIPKTYAEVFNARLRAINDDIELQKRRSNVQKNVESYPGELDLIKPV